MDVPLREFIERILTERQRALELQFSSNQRSVDQAAQALHEKLGQMNEFRSQIERSEATYLRRVDLIPLEARLKLIEESRAWLTGGLALLVVVLNVCLAIVLKVWK